MEKSRTEINELPLIPKWVAHVSTIPTKCSKHFVGQEVLPLPEGYTHLNVIHSKHLLHAVIQKECVFCVI